MIRVDIKKLDGTIGWSSQFPAQADVDQWVEAQSGLGAFGRVARTIRSDDMKITSEDISKALTAVPQTEPNPAPTVDAEGNQIQGVPATIPVLGLDGNPLILYTFAADYTVVQTDISALVAAQALVDQSAQAIAVGQAVLAKLRAINVGKTLNASQLQGMMADPAMQLALFELLTGSLSMAKAAINAVTNPVYTADDKAALVEIIDQSGLA